MGQFSKYLTTCHKFIVRSTYDSDLGRDEISFLDVIRRFTNTISDVYWPPITRTVALFIQAPAQDSPVPSLDSAGCSCGCRVRSSGAVVTVQRVRRRLQMSTLDSTRLDFASELYPRKPCTFRRMFCKLDVRRKSIIMLALS